MNDLLIQDLTIDWSKIEADSYLQKISPVRNLHRLEFNCPITFLPAKTAAENPPCLKLLRSAAVLTRRGERKTTPFPHTIPIPGSVMPSPWGRDTGGQSGVIFCGQRVFTM